MRTFRYASAGFLLGATWGVAARVWMRVISTAPEFSWGGTLSIIGAAAVIGTALGVVHAARRRGGSAWWRLFALLVPVIFASPGVVFLPAVVLGGWGLRRGVIGRVVAVVAILSAPVLLIAATWDDVETTLMPYPDNVYRAVLAIGALVLAGTAACAASTALGPWRTRPDSGIVEPGRPASVPA
jgi:hypothetical protein